MNHLPKIIALIALLLVAAAPPSFKGTATRWVDVDTVWVTKDDGKETVKVRIRWIDGPEAKQEHGQEAIAFVRKWLTDAPVTVYPTGKKTYDRIEASVVWNLGEPPWALGTDLNIDVAEMIVANGWAQCDPRYKPTEALQWAEQDAIANNRGIFVDWFPPTPPWEWRAQQKAKP
jgi:endonuclease YncB( thermonuclease family)